MGFSMQPYGIQSMLKEGHKHLSGLDEAVLKSIDACEQLSATIRTSVGPNGERLQNAEELIRMGLHPSEIISGYTKGINKTIELLDELVENGSKNMDVWNEEQVVTRMRAAVASKQFGQEDVLCSLVADACIQVCPKSPANFNVDNLHVAKLLGGGLHNSTVVRGMFLKNDAVGSIKRMEKAKVAVFAGGVDTSATETKGTVLMHSAEQLENYAETEEAKVEELI